MLDGNGEKLECFPVPTHAHARFTVVELLPGNQFGGILIVDLRHPFFHERRHPARWLVATRPSVLWVLEVRVLEIVEEAFDAALPLLVALDHVEVLTRGVFKLEILADLVDLVLARGVKLERLSVLCLADIASVDEHIDALAVDVLETPYVIYADARIPRIGAKVVV